MKGKRAEGRGGRDAITWSDNQCGKKKEMTTSRMQMQKFQLLALLK